MAQVCCLQPSRSIFIDTGEVEGGQKMNRLQAGTCKRAQVPHAGGIAVGEGQITAAMRSRHSGIGNAEVAHMQFVDAQVCEPIESRGTIFRQPFRFGRRTRKICEAALGSVDREVHGVRIRGWFSTALPTVGA